jgi:hypothetical protein
MVIIMNLCKLWYQVLEWFVDSNVTDLNKGCTRSETASAVYLLELSYDVVVELAFEYVQC